MLWIIKKGLYRMLHGLLRLVISIIKYPEQEILKGSGSIKKLPHAIKTRGIDSVLIVTDSMLIKLDLLKSLFKSLKDEQIQYTVYDGVQPNPTIENIEAGLELYNKNNCQAVIGFGGGSPMDCAKIVAARVTNPDQSVQQLRGLFKINNPLTSFFAVPTTAGTGSETTIAAVITDAETHEKFAVSDKKLMPAIAVLDPDLTLGLPPHITSTTGMDALTHAVEAYIGLHGTTFVRGRSEEAVKIIFKDLENVYKDGSLVEERKNMLWASFCGGAAFTRASVGYVHAIAHNLGGLYGVPHGLANAVILPYVLEVSKKGCEKKLAKLAIIGGIGSAAESRKILSQKFIDRVHEMNANMGIPRKIKELKKEDIPLIAKRASKEANPVYPVPRILNQKELKTLIGKLLP